MIQLDTIREWACPNCWATDVTKQALPHVRFHDCPKLGSLSAPMIEVGVRCKVFAVERGDYIGKEKVRLDANGRPVMSVVTVRDDGQDCIVFAPTATMA